MSLLKINRERLKKSILEMAKTAEGTGDGKRSRLALTEEDRKGRELFVKWLEEAGLEVRIDGIGNIWGIRPGKDTSAYPVMAGSHLDTVADGGIFDGVLGVLGALEVIRTLNDMRIHTDKPVAVVSFTNEEGARFQPDMMGSMVASGTLDVKEAWEASDDDNVTVGSALESIGFVGSDILKASAYLELHVEQGPLLDREGVKAGVVEGIQGIAWWRGKYTGEANHAGTTPMVYRKDTFVAVADLCCRIRKLADDLGNNTRTTMGRVHTVPDIVNVIPGETDFTIDFRQYDEDLFGKGKRRVENLVEKTAQRHGVSFELKQMVNARPVRFLPSMVDLVERAVQEWGYTNIRLSSGAGHDAQFMHRMCPSGMIFVPSVGGRSHCSEEWTEWEDAAGGVDILLQCILELAGS